MQKCGNGARAIARASTCEYVRVRVHEGVRERAHANGPVLTPTAGEREWPVTYKESLLRRGLHPREPAPQEKAELRRGYLRRGDKH